MPPKRKAPRANSRDQWNFISGREALEYKARINAGEELDTEILLRLLHADQACDELYSKSCKVTGSLSRQDVASMLALVLKSVVFAYI